MDVVRAVARPMLASTFIAAGWTVLRDPGSRVQTAEKVARTLADALPIPLPDDTEQLVRINAAVQVGAGALLAVGRFPRLSALALAASLAPTTAAGHPFWEVDDDKARAQQRIHFLKNVSMMGGLLLAALDTGGRPSIPYRTRRAAARGGAKVAVVPALAADTASRGVGAVASALPVGR